MNPKDYLSSIKDRIEQTSIGDYVLHDVPDGVSGQLDKWNIKNRMIRNILAVPVAIAYNGCIIVDAIDRAIQYVELATSEAQQIGEGWSELESRFADKSKAEQRILKKEFIRVFEESCNLEHALDKFKGLYHLA